MQSTLKKARLVLVFVWLLGQAWLLAAGALGEPLLLQPAVVVGSERTEILPQQLALLEDVDGRLSLEQVIAAWEAGQFRQGPELNANLGTTRSVFWARFVLDNPSAIPLRRVLTHDYAPTDDVQVFVPGAAGEWLPMHAGDSDISNDGGRRVPAFALDLAAAAAMPVYMRISTSSNLNFELSVWSPAQLERYERNFSLAYGLLFGAILATVLYLIFAWFLARDSTALLLAAYMLSYGSYLAFLDGFAGEWLLPTAAGAINSLHLASMGFLFGFGALFYRRYLNLKVANPRADRIVAVLQWLGFCIILNPVLPAPVIGIITLIVAGPGPLFTTGLACYLWAKQREQAGVFAIGWTVAHLSSFLGTLRVLGVVPNYEFLIHLPAIGCAVSFSCFAWGVARRLARDRLFAYEDPLTGLANRRRFDEHLSIEFDRACRYGRQLSLIMLDVDKFKSVNDRRGHSFGDRVLKALAIRCQELSRGTDLCARIGGEEFAIVLVETGMERAAEIAERLRAAQADAEIQQQSVTISLGVTGLQPADASMTELLERADRALYRAKRAGRNRVEISPPRPNDAHETAAAAPA